MYPTIETQKLDAIKDALQGKKSRVNKCVLAKDRQTLLITLQNGETYIFAPTREELIEYWEATYSKEEAENHKKWEDYSLEVWNHKERGLLAVCNREKWVRVRLKEVTLIQKVQRAINRKMWREYKNGRYSCKEIVRRYTLEGCIYVIVGEFEGIGLHIEAKSLQEAMNKLLENVRKVATAMSLQEMATA